MMDQYESLKLDHQLCFPLYASSKEMVRRYKPFLDAIGLTYTQYIAMLVLWEQRALSVKALGSYLYLDSGTLTPLLKKLEADGLVRRERDLRDERSVVISVTEKGLKLRDEALTIPDQIENCLNLSPEDTKQLYGILYKLLGNLRVE